MSSTTRAASQLPGVGPTDIWIMSLHLHVKKTMMIMRCYSVLNSEKWITGSFP